MQNITQVISAMESVADDPSTDDETANLILRVSNRLSYVGMPFEAPLTPEEKSIIEMFM